MNLFTTLFLTQPTTGPETMPETAANGSDYMAIVCLALLVLGGIYLLINMKKSK